MELREGGRTELPADADLYNRLSFKHKTVIGLSPLCYAIAKCNEQLIRNLIKLGADPCKKMEDGKTTALFFAVTYEKKDCSELVRVLLSLGSLPSEIDGVGVLSDEQKKSLKNNRTMRYWLKHSLNYN